ncbi:hypothetical protein COT77_00765 [Candidatus Berkelbacteria bacterium CG10_big_fil_rev_8_21_14_0_10_41_12]|uniref:Uncharacterized protein n=1 Tax=Candidatus Berkelbacteria bacterium CG10_big_fil_rev_8_21_14_0_10_41_12 TaxID=1974513 RepID=A0A2M6WXL9_9BACT|nr:MAG: hypothetical protein COT77_00765 [Candidatus Berkelbacteria bacterium CG10_big_fil_rev_8_21_14_0_10_41_12]
MVLVFVAFVVGALSLAKHKKQVTASSGGSSGIHLFKSTFSDDTYSQSKQKSDFLPGQDVFVKITINTSSSIENAKVEDEIFEVDGNPENAQLHLPDGTTQGLATPNISDNTITFENFNLPSGESLITYKYKQKANQ